MRGRELGDAVAETTRPVERMVPVRNTWSMYLRGKRGDKAGWRYVGGNRIYLKVRTMAEFMQFAKHMAETAEKWAEEHGGKWERRTRLDAKQELPTVALPPNHPRTQTDLKIRVTDVPEMPRPQDYFDGL